MKGNPLPFGVVGVSVFDGAGNFSTAYTDMSPGQPTYIPVQGNGSGPYTVNFDVRLHCRLQEAIGLATSDSTTGNTAALNYSQINSNTGYVSLLQAQGANS